MTDVLMPSLRRVAPAAARRGRRTVHALLERLAVGRLDIIDNDGRAWHYEGASPGPRATLRVHNETFYARVLRGGDIGLGESFIAHEWSSPDLVALLDLAMRNRDVLDRAVYGSWWGMLMHRVLHAWRRNSRNGSQRNIEAHYDLGNAFYRLWLDPTMNYSSAWFGDAASDGAGSRVEAATRTDADLASDATRYATNSNACQAARSIEAAQNAKVDRALDEARVREGSRVLEIGCGWGALAERAARRGASVKGVTLSHEQLAWGQQRLLDAGLADRATLQWQDYRDLGQQAQAFEPYDAIVSIEMFEAVGRDYWAGYFQTLARCMAPQGRACVQTITIRDDLFARYLRSSDFIQRYVFPGGLLPSPSAFREEAAKAGLIVERELAFGADYARTLHHWRHAFLTAVPQVRALGYDEAFVRLWEFYLAYCEAAFATGNTDVRQFTLKHA